MCGLIFHLRTNPPSEPNQTSRLDTLIQARGPDSFHTINKTLKSNNGSNLHLTFSASVLALRGTSVVSQPMTDEATGCLLMWNGEAWKLRGQVIKENDTQVAFRALLEAVAGVSDAGTRTLAFRDVLANVTGPFAFLFYDALSQRILYGRDPVGRRSLMRNRTLNGDVCIASVSDAATTATAELEWEEVQTGGIYELDLSHAGIDMAPRESFIAWGTSTEVSPQSQLS